MGEYDHQQMTIWRLREALKGAAIGAEIIVKQFECSEDSMLRWATRQAQSVVDRARTAALTDEEYAALESEATP